MKFQQIKRGKRILALILRKGLDIKGKGRFFTSHDNSLQLGIHKRKRGSEIDPHFHKRIKKIISDVQEALHIQSGKVEINFYDDSGKEVRTEILNIGDTVLLISGGHGFKMLKDSKIIEIKQGPYEGRENDKTYLKLEKAVKHGRSV